VFQFHYLLSEFSVLKNVMLPGLKLGKKQRCGSRARAMELLRDLEMEDQALKRPTSSAAVRNNGWPSRAP
jgi:lipoprotein-releasing system ATP-binding protein